MIEFVKSKSEKEITQFWIDRCLRLEAENLKLRIKSEESFEDWWAGFKTPDTDYPHIKAYVSSREAWRIAKEQERERCAMLIESYPEWIGTNAKREIANAIRNESSA